MLLWIEWPLSAFIGFGTGKPLAAESSSPQSPGASPQGGNSPKRPGSPKAAQQSLEEGKESPQKRGETHGMAFLTSIR